MICSKCIGCSWYKELDFCGGLKEFQIYKCPIEGKLEQKCGLSHTNKQK